MIGDPIVSGLLYHTQVVLDASSYLLYLQATRVPLGVAQIWVMVKFAQQFVCCRLFALLEEVRVVTLRKCPRVSVGV